MSLAKLGFNGFGNFYPPPPEDTNSHRNKQNKRITFYINNNQDLRDFYNEVGYYNNYDICISAIDYDLIINQPINIIGNLIIISRSSIVSHLPIAASVTIYSIKNVAINLEDYVDNHKIQVYENITSEDLEKITSISSKLVI